MKDDRTNKDYRISVMFYTAYHLSYFVNVHLPYITFLKYLIYKSIYCQCLTVKTVRIG